ncbi:MAG: sigma-E factor regulatory protein RseB domain-containing protein [Planctomycetota bacterium]
MGSRALSARAPSTLRAVGLRAILAMAMLAIVGCEDPTDPEIAALLSKAEAAQQEFSADAIREFTRDGSVLRERISVRWGELLEREALSVDGKSLDELPADVYRQVELWTELAGTALERYQYAEFRIQGDPRRLWQSYEIEREPGRDVEIAGHYCLALHLVPKHPSSRLAFRAWVDPRSGLVLGYERVSWTGETIESMRFIELELQTPSSGPGRREKQDDELSSLGGNVEYMPLNEALEAVRFRPMMPRYRPDGFSDHLTAILRFDRPPVPRSGSEWIVGDEYLLHSMTDGLNRLFLISLPADSLGSAKDGGSHLGGSAGNRVVVSRFPITDDSSLSAFMVVDENVATFVIGTLSEPELITIIESLAFVR